MSWCTHYDIRYAIIIQINTQLPVFVDLVAEDQIACTAGDIHTVLLVIGDPVAGARRCTADLIPAHVVLDFNPVVIAVSAIEQAGGIGTDEISLDDIVVGIDLDPFKVVGNHVAGLRSRAPDGCPVCVGENGDANVCVTGSR